MKIPRMVVLVSFLLAVAANFSARVFAAVPSLRKNSDSSPPVSRYQSEEFSKKIEYEKTDPNYRSVSFEALTNFKYDLPDEEVFKKGAYKNQVPREIKELDGQKVALRGFMLPGAMKDNRASNFVFMPNQMTCCYGVSPPDNGWVFVTMKSGKTADFTMDVPVTIYGVLEVGEKNDPEVGMCLYRMICEKVEVHRGKTPTFY